MSDRSTEVRHYSTVAMWFHWTIAAAVIANLAIGLLHDAMPAGSMGVHKALGITVLVLTAGRIAWRIGHRPPPLPAHTPGWERGAAHATHGLLYILMVAMPVSGWLMVSGTATRRPLTWFGLFDIPYLPVGPAAGQGAGNAHGLFGWLMLALVVLHIGAALRHRFLLRDHILARMASALDR